MKLLYVFDTNNGTHKISKKVHDAVTGAISKFDPPRIRGEFGGPRRGSIEARLVSAMDQFIVSGGAPKDFDILKELSLILGEEPKPPAR